MNTPENIEPNLQPELNLLITNSSDCSCNEPQKTCPEHKMAMENDKDNASNIKCALDSRTSRYTNKPPLLPKPKNISLISGLWKAKHQSRNVSLSEQKYKTVNHTVSEINENDSKLKNDSDINSNTSLLEVPSNLNNIIGNNVTDSENNNYSINHKICADDLSFQYQDDSLLNDYEIINDQLDVTVVQFDDITLEDEKSTIVNDSLDHSYSIRKKIVNWFGSFGKGKTLKLKKRSSFYDSTDDTDSHSSLDLQSNENVEYDETLSIKNVETEKIPTKTKSLRIVEELISTEKIFIGVLKLLCQTFILYVEKNAHDTKLIPSADLHNIMSPLPQLLSLNEDLLEDMELRLKNWNENPKIADVIVKKGPFLKLYSTYIQNFENQCNFFDECCQKYPRFQKCVKDFEASDICKRLTIKHYMLKPIQRIPQYRLLLENYLKNQDTESIDYEDTKTALHIVCNVAYHANKSIEQGDSLSKLLQIQSQLGNYVVIKPGRELIKQGELYKLSRKDMQLRYFILLNDCLLYTSNNGTISGLKLNYELPLSGMKVFLPMTNDYHNEFSIITITRSFTLSAKSSMERDDWVTTLEKAIREHNNRQSSFQNMKFTPKNAVFEPLHLGYEAPIWIQDCRVTMCQSCTSVFTVTFRRHHCRACGKVVCSRCSENKAPLRYKKFQSARVCDECYDYLLKEFESKMSEMQLESNSDDVEIFNVLDTIKNSFKKSEVLCSKKLIKFVPQRFKEVAASDTSSQISGWLYWREKRKSWKKFWFVLKKQVLYMYKASEDIAALKTIPVLGYSVQTFSEGTSYEVFDSSCVFQLIHDGQNPLIFCADKDIVLRWVNALTEATKLN